MIKEKMTTWTQRLDFSMLSAWLLLSSTLAVIAYIWFGMDFSVYYAAARVLTEGGNPYDYGLVAKVLLEMTGKIGNNAYYYPPWFAWIFVPLSILPFQIARAVWLVINVIVWNIGLWQLSKIIEWPPIGWRRYGLFALSTFSLAWITWRYEQAGILVFMVLVSLIVSIQKENWTMAGILLALLLIKPNLTLVVVAGVSLWLIHRRQWRVIWVMVLVLIVLLAISTWITPDWFQPILEEGFSQGLTVALDGPDRVVAVRINTTFLDWSRTLGVQTPWNRLLYGLAICIGIFVFFWSAFRAESVMELVSRLLLVSYAITPYALQYDYPSLAIPLFWALSRCTTSPKALVVGSVLAGFVFSVIFWQQNISWAYWMVVGSIALMLWAFLSRKNYSGSPRGISSNS